MAWTEMDILYTHTNRHEKINNEIIRTMTSNNNTYNIHIICPDNTHPEMEVEDNNNVQQMIRTVEYVDSEEDFNVSSFLNILSLDAQMKLTVFKYLSGYFNMDYTFEMPYSVREHTYSLWTKPIHERVAKFVSAYVVKDATGYITLSEARKQFSRFDSCIGYYKLCSFRDELVKQLSTTCLPQKKIDKHNFKNVFMGWRWRFNSEDDQFYDALIPECKINPTGCMHIGTQ